MGLRFGSHLAVLRKCVNGGHAAKKQSCTIIHALSLSCTVSLFGDIQVDVIESECVSYFLIFCLIAINMSLDFLCR